MKIVRNVGSVFLLLVGGIWFLQGIGVLPGSFMSGQTRWAVYGGLMAAFVAALLVRTNRRP